MARIGYATTAGATYFEFLIDALQTVNGSVEGPDFVSFQFNLLLEI